MSATSQEWLALAIVAFVAIRLARKAFFSTAAQPLAGYFLKKGKVKWAMRLKSRAGDEGSSCGGCSCTKSSSS